MIWLVCGLVVILLPIAGLAGLSLTAGRPATLGVTNGKLAPCPDSPNCVSSQATNEAQRVDPIPLPDQLRIGSPEETASDPGSAGDVLARIVKLFPGAKVVRQTDGYVHAEFRSRLFRFVDDVEFYVDVPAGVIHVRSASRVGHSDLGVNRQRVELLRAAVAEMSN